MYKRQIQDRVAQIKNEIENTKSSYDKEKLQERLAKLAGGVAVSYTHLRSCLFEENWTRTLNLDDESYEWNEW